MLNLVYCEILKLKNAKMVGLSVMGAMAVPVMMFLEAIQVHFEHPEQVFALADIYDDSLLYVMLLVNTMVYVAVTAYLFSREYEEKTLKTILPLPVLRVKLLFGKFITLFLWTVVLSVVSWGGILIFSGCYSVVFGLEGFELSVILQWLVCFVAGGILVFLTISPYAYLAEKTKGIVAPMIVVAVMVMGNAALCNQKFGALYPWVSTYLLMKGELAGSGYPVWLSLGLVVMLSIFGYAATFSYFLREDLK